MRKFFSQRALDKMTMGDTPPFELPPAVRVSGTNYEIGQQVGAAFKRRIQTAMETSPDSRKMQKFAHEYPKRVAKARKLTEKYFAPYIKEIQGIADGAETDFFPLLLFNFRHMAFPETEDCSTLVKNDIHHHYIAHNEDEELTNSENCYLVIYDLDPDSLVTLPSRASQKSGKNRMSGQGPQSDGRLQFFAHCYPGSLPGTSFGFNSYGIVHSCNAVPDPIRRPGVPRIFMGRYALEAATLQEAIARVQSVRPRAGGAAYNFGSYPEREFVNVETTGTRAHVTDVFGVYYRTNHYLSPPFKRFLKFLSKTSTSLSRYQRFQSLRAETVQDTAEALQILRDPKIMMDALKYPGGRTYITLATALFEFDPTFSVTIYGPPGADAVHSQLTMDDLFHA